MMKPLFTIGKELERALSQSETAGTKILRVPTPGDFSVGDLIFCGEADGTGVEFLGAVTNVGASTLTVTYGLAEDRDTSDNIWRAATSFRWESVSAEPLERAFHEGIAVERSVGGALWSVRVGNAVREDVLRFAGISRSHFVAFRAWLSSEARAGLDDFTWVDESRAVAAVRLLDCDFEQVEKPPGAVTLAVKLAVLEEGGYA